MDWGQGNNVNKRPVQVLAQMETSQYRHMKEAEERWTEMNKVRVPSACVRILEGLWGRKLSKLQLSGCSSFHRTETRGKSQGGL
jgi:hypothetical protein